MTIKSQIKNLVSKTISQKIDFTVEIPQEKIHGDYATNVAMILSGKIKTRLASTSRRESRREEPMVLAETIRLKLKDNELFERVEVVKPGFINLFLKPQFLQKQIKEIVDKKENFGAVNVGKNKKVQVEFISANPTGLLTLGNGRGGFTGDVLANIFKKAGYKTQREYYINDSKNSKQIQELGKTTLAKGKTYLNDYLRTKINKLKSKIRNIKKEGEAGYIVAQEINKDIKNSVEKKLKIKFDKWFSEEKELYKTKKVEKIYNLLKRKGVIYKKENAEWIKTSKYGADKDWVIIRETGEPTYFLPDIAYHYNKFKERKFDKVINIWGADHHGYIKRMKAATKIIGINPDRLDIIIMQLVRLVEKGKEVRMSKRKGQYILLEDLINEVGLDVARFFFLMYSANRHMDFDLGLAKEKSEKNPIYYIQYAYARINSILRKAKLHEIRTTKYELLNHPSELNLIKELIKLPEIVEDTVGDYQVQRLTHYALDVATAFHRFYTDCKVLGEDKDLEKARLSLIKATKIVLENILDLMGISKPQKM